MEIIQIEDGKDKLIVNFEDSKLWGYKFHPDNSFEAIDRSVLNYFEIFQLSNDRMPLDNEGEYQVILDKRTKFKHYFKNGVEDLEMFFFNNGEDATDYSDGEGSKKGISRLFTTKVLAGIVAIELTLVAFLGINHARELSVGTKTAVVVEEQVTAPLTIGEVYGYISNSTRLSDEDKEILLDGEPFYNQVLETTNKSEYAKYCMRNRLEDIGVEIFEKIEDEPMVSGRYYGGNTLYVREDCYYSSDLDYKKHVMWHEFIHAWEPPCTTVGTAVFRESMAEMVGGEITERILSYPKAREANRYLASVIGTEPIWDFIFSGDFSPIEQAVQPYLSPEEYDMFLNSLGDAQDSNKLAMLNEIIVKLADEYGYGNNYAEDEIYYIKELSPDKRETINLIRTIKLGDTKILKYDWKGNCLGDATYDDAIDPEYNNYENRGQYYYVVKTDMDICDGKYIDSCTTTQNNHFLHDEPKITEEKLITFDEFARQFKLTPEEDDFYYKEFPNSDKKHFEYPDGSVVDILDDLTVIRRDKEGREERYEVEAPVSVHVSDNGYIYWDLRVKELYGNNAFRFIYPDGLKQEIKILDGEKYYCANQMVDSISDEDYNAVVLKNEFSTGETFYKGAGIIIPYKHVQGETFISSSNNVLIDWIDNNGNKIGRKKIEYSNICWYDNDGNVVMNQDLEYPDEFSVCDSEKCVFANGTTKIYDSLAKTTTYLYPNGRSVKIVDRSVVTFYDENGKEIDIGLGPICRSGKFSLDGEGIYGIRLYNEDVQPGESPFVSVNAGKCMINYVRDEEKKMYVVGTTKEIGPQTKKID